jgi:diadenosine tetraphosphatase ApaH/serine/threonine PP2A family protein phosphatase
MRPVGVPDEPGVQRLDAVEPLRVEIGGVLSGRDPKVRMPRTSSGARAAWFRSYRWVKALADRTDARLVFGHDADALTDLRREPFYD